MAVALMHLPRWHARTIVGPAARRVGCKWSAKAGDEICRREWQTFVAEQSSLISYFDSSVGLGRLSSKWCGEVGGTKEGIPENRGMIHVDLLFWRGFKGTR